MEAIRRSLGETFWLRVMREKELARSRCDSMFLNRGCVGSSRSVESKER